MQTTKILAAFGAALTIFAGSASAETAYDWTGRYMGMTFALNQVKTHATDITGEEYGPPGSTMSLDDNAFSAGIYGGYNFQRGNWVYGPEVEFGYATNDALAVNNADEDDGIFTRLNRQASLSARIGYAQGSTLFYAKAGLAWANIRTAAGDFDSHGNEDSGGKWGFDGDEAGFGEGGRTGRMIGIGVEQGVTMQLRLRAEYTFADFGTQRIGGVDGYMDEPFDVERKQSQVKLGITYAF